MLLVGLLGWAALFAATGAAVAKAGWGLPQTLGHGVAAAAGNAQGVEAFIWKAKAPGAVRVGNRRRPIYDVRARLRLPDGRLTSPESISRTARLAARPRAIGLDARGTATAVWTERRSSRVRIMVAVRAPGKRFGRPIEAAKASAFGVDVKLAVAADGAAVIVWSRLELIHAVHRAAGPCATGSARACFGPVQRIPGHCPGGAIDCRDTQVAFGPRGRAYLAWSAVEDRVDVPGNVIRLAVASDGRAFGPPRTIPADDPAWQPTIAVLPDGKVVLAWLGEPASGGARITATVVDRDGRPVSAAQTVAAVPVREGCYRPHVRATRQGEATLVWQCNPESLPEAFPVGRIASAVRPPGGAFGAATAIAPADSHAMDPLLAVDSRGNTLLVYRDDGRILARERSPGQGFEAPVLVGTGQPSQLLAAGDMLTVMWPASGGTMLSDWRP